MLSSYAYGRRGEGSKGLMLECLSMSIAGAAGGLAYILYRDWREEEAASGPEVSGRGRIARLKRCGRTMLIGAMGGFVVWGTGGARDFASDAAIPARMVTALAVGAAGPHYVLGLIQKSQAQELQASSTRTVDEVTAKTQASLDLFLELLQAAAPVQTNEGKSDVRSGNTASDTGDQIVPGSTREGS